MSEKVPDITGKFWPENKSDVNFVPSTKFEIKVGEQSIVGQLTIKRSGDTYYISLMTPNGQSLLDINHDGSAAHKFFQGQLEEAKASDALKRIASEINKIFDKKEPAGRDDARFVHIETKDVPSLAALLIQLNDQTSWIKMEITQQPTKPTHGGSVGTSSAAPSRTGTEPKSNSPTPQNTSADAAPHHASSKTKSCLTEKISNVDFAAITGAIAHHKEITLSTGEKFNGAANYDSNNIRTIYGMIKEKPDTRSKAILATSFMNNFDADTIKDMMGALSDTGKPLPQAATHLAKTAESVAQYNASGGKPLCELGNEAPAAGQKNTTPARGASR